MNLRKKNAADELEPLYSNIMLRAQLFKSPTVAMHQCSDCGTATVLVTIINYPVALGGPLSSPRASYLRQWRPFTTISSCCLSEDFLVTVFELTCKVRRSWLTASPSLSVLSGDPHDNPGEDILPPVGARRMFTDPED